MFLKPLGQCGGGGRGTVFQDGGLGQCRFGGRVSRPTGAPERRNQACIRTAVEAASTALKACGGPGRTLSGSPGPPHDSRNHTPAFPAFAAL